MTCFSVYDFQEVYWVKQQLTLKLLEAALISKKFSVFTVVDHYKLANLIVIVILFSLIWYKYDFIIHIFLSVDFC